MNNLSLQHKTLKKSALALAISSALILSACGGSNDNTASQAASNAEFSQTANVSVGVAFPKTASAAAIDNNAQSIVVRFFPSSAGSIDEAIEAVDALADCFEGDTSGCDDSHKVEDEPLEQMLILTASSPSDTLALAPGKYRIEAMQFDVLNPTEGDEPISASSTFATLAQGDNRVELNMLHATWTNTSNISLQLLHQNAMDGDTVVDLDRDTDGNQTFAEALGLTGQAITGMHIIGGPVFAAAMGETFNDTPDDSMATAAEGPSPEICYGDGYDYEDCGFQLMAEWQGPAQYASLIRQAGVSGGAETVVFNPERNHHDYWYNELTDRSYEIERSGGGATLLLQEYTAAGNKNMLIFPEMSVEVDVHGEMDGSRLEQSAGLTTIPFLFEDVDISESGDNILISFGDDSWHYIYEHHFTSLEGSDNLTILNISPDVEDNMTFPNDSNRIDQIEPPSVTGGTTINGTLIEYLVTSTESRDTTTPGAVPDDIRPQVMMQFAAQKAGLVASAAATANGENCSTFTDTFSDYYATYVWNADTESWVGGTVNYTYFVTDSDGDGVNDTVGGEDLNGNGAVEPFEAGVFYNNTCQWTDGALACEDLDGVANDNNQQYETVVTLNVGTGNGEYCLHPFTMTASQMSFDVSSLVANTELQIQGE